MTPQNNDGGRIGVGEPDDAARYVIHSSRRHIIKAETLNAPGKHT